MKQSEKHRIAFEAYYLSRNVSAVAREINTSRQSVGKWKEKFKWDEECADRDHEIGEKTREVMLPEWVKVKAKLITAFIDQIEAAMKQGITPENSRDMVAVSKELRGLMGEADKHEIDIAGIEYVLADETKQDTSE
jgi:hypothetical protein